MQARLMTQKARTLFLHPMLKAKLREAAPELVPVTSDAAADREIYEQSKAALEGYEMYARKWPRPCNLLCGRDEHGEPAFLYSKEVDDGEEPAPFTAFVDAVAKECEIEVRCSFAARRVARAPAALPAIVPAASHTHLLCRVASCILRVCLRECFAPAPHQQCTSCGCASDAACTSRLAHARASPRQPNDISPNLVAFLAFIAGQIASVSPRKRGWHKGAKIQGDLADHGTWDAGIASALRFMKDRSKCRTHAHLVKAIQKETKK
jgi:hypothetical protein